MKERFPSLVALILLGVLVLLTWWASDYALRAIEIDPPRRITHERDSWASGFVLMRSDPAGLAINRLDGSLMEHFPDTDDYEISAPKAIGMQPGTPVILASARSGVLQSDGQRVILLGDAHMQRLPQADLQLLDVRSERLVIEPELDLVHTDLPAVVINGSSSLRGTGMRYDNRTRKLNVMAASDVKISGADQAAHNAPNNAPQKAPSP